MATGRLVATYIPVHFVGTTCNQSHGLQPAEATSPRFELRTASLVSFRFAWTSTSIVERESSQTQTQTQTLCAKLCICSYSGRSSSSNTAAQTQVL